MSRGGGGAGKPCQPLLREWAVLIVLLLVVLDVVIHRIRQKRKAKTTPKHME